jgi:hypothetical protein
VKTVAVSADIASTGCASIYRHNKLTVGMRRQIIINVAKRANGAENLSKPARGAKCKVRSIQLSVAGFQIRSSTFEGHYGLCKNTDNQQDCGKRSLSIINYQLMLRSQRLMIEPDAFFVPEAQRTLAGGGAIAQPPET